MWTPSKIDKSSSICTCTCTCVLSVSGIDGAEMISNNINRDEEESVEATSSNTVDIVHFLHVTPERLLTDTRHPT